MPDLSIVIRTYNEEEHLPALFDCLAGQRFRDFETIIVDSGSVDSTREIAEQRADHVVRINQEDFTFGYSLNRGIRHGSGRAIAIISAHAFPVDADWLTHLIEPFSNPKTAMVFGRQEGVARSKFSESMDFARTFGREREVLDFSNIFANNANSAIRRDLWERHPFDEGLPGLEDAQWAKYWMGEGYQVVYQPSASIYHIHSESWKQVRHRYYREGQAAKWIGVRHAREIPMEVVRETKSFWADLASATRQGLLRKNGRDIVRYRLAKLAGTCRGIWDGARMSSPSYRQALFFESTYKAVVIHGRRRASLDEIEIPHVKPSEVLVRVGYEGVCATDLEVLEGSLGYYKDGLADYPIVPGHEFSGRIAAVGVRVNGLSEGTRVVVECIQSCGACAACNKGYEIGCSERKEVGVIGRDGGYAEYMITPARFVHELPNTLTLKDACLCEPTAVVLKGLGKLRNAWGPGDAQRKCAVVGAGLIGQLCARVLMHRGHQVTVLDRNPQRLECSAKAGLETQENLAQLDTFEAIVEATGAQDALRAVLHDSGASATILLLGMSYGASTFDFEQVVGYDKTIVGSVGSGHDDFEQAIELLQHLDTSTLIEKVLPLSEFQQAWQTARSGEALKVVLRVDSSLDARGIT